MIAMTDHNALYAAILADPKSHRPREIYADFIERDNPDRAEFIRTQIQLASLPDCDHQILTPKRSCERCQLRQELWIRERDLFSRLPIPEGIWVVQTTWHRVANAYRETRHGQYGPKGTYVLGLIGSITCTFREFIEVADGLIWAPPVRCACCDGLGFLSTYGHPQCPRCFGSKTIPLYWDETGLLQLSERPMPRTS